MLFYSFLAVAIGGATGSLLRWGTGILLNPVLSNLPLGTLTVNLVGGYLIGISVAFFAGHPNLPDPWRLLVITGFLGGLTTFSSFSAEVTTMFLEENYGWALMTAASHLFGSLLLTTLGIYTFKWLHG
jgi:CrcB protein